MGGRELGSGGWGAQRLGAGGEDALVEARRGQGCGGGPIGSPIVPNDLSISSPYSKCQ